MANESRVHSGLRAYSQAQQAAITPTQASILLHERLCQELLAAKSAYRARRLDRMCRHLEKCYRVLLALHSDLKRAPGGAGPRILGGFYLHLFQRLRKILRNPDVEAEFDAIATLLRSFCEKMRASAN